LIVLRELFVGIQIGEIIEVGNIRDIRTRFSEVFSLGEEYELIDNHLCFIELGSIFTIDNTSLEMSFYVDEFALGKELLRSFCERAPCNTIGILSIWERFSRRTLIVTIGCNSEGCDFFVGSSGFDKWILGNITNEDNLVDSTHRGKILEIIHLF
jgi:hypothetical protein